MDVKQQIKNYIESEAEPKRSEMKALHQRLLKLLPKRKLWYFDGKDDKGKMVTNPNVGYGSYNIHYANGTSREFYQVGFSRNTAGISFYIMGLKDKKYLAKTYGKKLGKATVTGYCIKFKTIEDIDLSVLDDAILHGVKETD